MKNWTMWGIAIGVNALAVLWNVIALMAHVYENTRWWVLAAGILVNGALVAYLWTIRPHKGPQT